jgi:hypothetical protein
MHRAALIVIGSMAGMLGGCAAPQRKAESECPPPQRPVDCTVGHSQQCPVGVIAVTNGTAALDNKAVSIPARKGPLHMTWRIKQPSDYIFVPGDVPLAIDAPFTGGCVNDDEATDCNEHPGAPHTSGKVYHWRYTDVNPPMNYTCYAYKIQVRDKNHPSDTLAVDPVIVIQGSRLE